MSAAARPVAAATPHRTPPRPAQPSPATTRACPADAPRAYRAPETDASTRAYRGSTADDSTGARPGPGAALGVRPLDRPGPGTTPAYLTVPADATASRDPYARLARGCRPRGCRAPARRVHGRRVRYVIGDEPGQVNGMRWRARTARLRHR
ncbi:tryptophan biosynthesis modulator TrpM [Streptomyces sp. NPDC000229]|uniref:tryptophan biosynthesis modulator TrpM n=1 Tax=Streptomyces sp. NPDC000229 TaxID=3154247 RepID=UPI0040379CAB